MFQRRFFVWILKASQYLFEIQSGQEVILLEIQMEKRLFTL